MLAAMAVTGLAACAPAARPDASAAPPRTELARRDDVVDLLHGVSVPDPYRWLEDEASAATKAWVESEADAARRTLDALPGRAVLEQRFKDLLYVDTVSAPERKGNRLFFMRKPADREKAYLVTRPAAGGDEQLLIDPMTLSDDGSVALGDWSVSPDGRLVAWQSKANNADEATLRIRDVATGVDLAESIEGAKYASPAWLPDGSGFYYTWLPPLGGDVTEERRPGLASIRFHRIGDDPATDATVFEPTGSPETFVALDVTDDGRWLLLYVARGWNSTEVWFRERAAPGTAVDAGPIEGADALLTEVDARARAAGFRRLSVGRGANVSVDAFGDRFFMLTNDGAPRYRVVSVDPARPEPAQWREVVAESAAKLDSMRIAGGHLVLGSLTNASGRLEVRDLDGRLVRPIELPGIGSVTALQGEPDHDEIYYGFSSFTQPTEIVKASVASGVSERWARVEIPADTSDMVVEQVRYPSKDGTEITMFLVHRRDAPRDGSNPTMLYGYGGFNVDMTPSFSSGVVTWLELGGVYALPNLRGGGEYGESWHQAGMGANKQNVFDDYIAAAEYLEREGWTRPERLAIRGGSNGGLLVGAAMTQRPDLFDTVVCAVPLLDMVRYHLFGSGRTWIPEYGSAEDPQGFATLFGYSPYHRVTEGVRYPALLMMAADHDDRVDPMHARKFTAAVQWAVRDVEGASPVLFRLERNAGHGGADLVRQTVASNTDMWAFVASRLGVDVPAGLGGAGSAPAEEPRDGATRR
jgi:prolyl oligopeptidase